MTMSDPLGDMLTRIRNGQQASKEIVEAPFSRLRENVCKVLQDEGYIRGYKVEEQVRRHSEPQHLIDRQILSTLDPQRHIFANAGSFGKWR